MKTNKKTLRKPKLARYRDPTLATLIDHLWYPEWLVKGRDGKVYDRRKLYPSGTVVKWIKYDS